MNTKQKIDRINKLREKSMSILDNSYISKEDVILVHSNTKETYQLQEELWKSGQRTFDVLAKLTGEKRTWDVDIELDYLHMTKGYAIGIVALSTRHYNGVNRVMEKFDHHIPSTWFDMNKTDLIKAVKKHLQKKKA